MLPPSGAHWLGTDHLGRDILSMLMVGARTSIAVAVVAVGMGMVLGVPLGLLAAATRGSLLDEVVMRGNDLIFAFPSLVIAILITAVFGPSAVNAIIAIGIFNTPVFARVTRGAALSLWTLDYIKAARVAGKGTARISVEHILPNVANLLIVQGTIQFSLGHPRGGGAVLRGARGAAADAFLGADARGQPDDDLARPAHGDPAGARHRAGGAGAEPDGRRLARCPRSAREAGAMTLLRVEGLSLDIHGHPILRDVGFAVEEGEVFGLVGESGSGKSMTALALMGLLPQGARVSGGRAAFGGRDLLAVPEREMCGLRGREIGMIFQEPMTALNPVQTIGDQVAETLVVHGVASRAEAARVARERLDRVGLPEADFPLGRYPHELSGGQRQRVCIAMAVALRPEAPHRGRADDGARRDDAGADPRAAARPRAGGGHGAHAHHP